MRRRLYHPIGGGNRRSRRPGPRPEFAGGMQVNRGPIANLICDYLQGRGSAPPALARPAATADGVRRSEASPRAG